MVHLGTYVVQFTWRGTAVLSERRSGSDMLSELYTPSEVSARRVAVGFLFGTSSKVSARRIDVGSLNSLNHLESLLHGGSPWGL
jgi:hypothetical protein